MNENIFGAEKKWQSSKNRVFKSCHALEAISKPWLPLGPIQRSIYYITCKLVNRARPIELGPIHMYAFLSAVGKFKLLFSKTIGRPERLFKRLH
jgi:hypothetical protein